MKDNNISKVSSDSVKYRPNGESSDSHRTKKYCAQTKRGTKARREKKKKYNKKRGRRKERKIGKK